MIVCVTNRVNSKTFVEENYKICTNRLRLKLMQWTRVCHCYRESLNSEKKRNILMNWKKDWKWWLVLHFSMHSKNTIQVSKQFLNFLQSIKIIFYLLIVNASKLVGLFQKIRRENELVRHYYNSRQIPLEQTWAEFESSLNQLNQPNSPQQSQQHQSQLFINFLPNFYDEILFLIDKEVCVLLEKLKFKPIHFQPFLLLFKFWIYEK